MARLSRAACKWLNDKVSHSYSLYNDAQNTMQLSQLSQRSIVNSAPRVKMANDGGDDEDPAAAAADEAGDDDNGERGDDNLVNEWNIS